MSETKADYEEALKEFVEVVSKEVGQKSRAHFRKGTEADVKLWMSQAIERDNRLATCRVPLGEVPDGDSWYIRHDQIPANWHSSILTEAQDSAENSLHRQLINAIHTLYKEQFVSKLVNAKIVKFFSKLGVSRVLDQLARRITFLELGNLPGILRKLPEAEAALLGTQIASTLSSELALSLALSDDILKRHYETIDKAAEVYGSIEIRTRLDKSLIMFAREDAMRFVKPSNGFTEPSYWLQPDVFISRDEIKSLTSQTIDYDANFFRCPSYECGFESRFIRICNENRNKSLHALEKLYEAKYSTSLPSERIGYLNISLPSKYPIYKVIRFIREGQTYSPPTTNFDPLKGFTSSG